MRRPRHTHALQECRIDTPISRADGLTTSDARTALQFREDGFDRLFLKLRLREHVLALGALRFQNSGCPFRSANPWHVVSGFSRIGEFMPCLRHTSLTGTLESRFRAIWPSVNCEFLNRTTRMSSAEKCYFQAIFLSGELAA